MKKLCLLSLRSRNLVIKGPLFLKTKGNTCLLYKVSGYCRHVSVLYSRNNTGPVLMYIHTSYDIHNMISRPIWSLRYSSNQKAHNSTLQDANPDTRITSGKSSYSSVTDQDNCQLFRTRRPATDEYWRVIKLAANIQVPSCGRTRIRPVLAQHCVSICGVSFSTGPALGQRWPVVVFLVIIVYIITLHVSCASRIGRLMS